MDAEAGKVVGSAWVMEVWENMVRLNLDGAASAFGGAKRIRFSRSLGEEGGTKPIAGKAQLFGAGAFQKLLLSNESEADWSRCHVLLSTNRIAQLERVPAQSTAEVFLSKFRSMETTNLAPVEYVWVECLEGKAKLTIEP